MRQVGDEGGRRKEVKSQEVKKGRGGGWRVRKAEIGFAREQWGQTGELGGQEQDGGPRKRRLEG